MLDLTLALLLFLLPLAYSPGPGNMVFAAIGARFGSWAPVPASLGYHLATWVVTATVGLGFAGTTAQAPLLQEALLYAGSGYVLWLARGFLRAGGATVLVEPRRAGLGDGVALLPNSDSAEFGPFP
jgi:threonine/homoserine/homoserine lactone efflux protein